MIAVWIVCATAAVCAASALRDVEETFGWHNRCLRPVLAAAVMVKNEVDVMPTTMAMLERMRIGRLYVYDTGSTDGTQAMLWREARRRRLELFLLQGQFVDFAVSRNVLLSFALGGSDWLLLLDSGEDLAVTSAPGAASIEQVLLSVPDNVCGIEMVQQWDQMQFLNVRIVRNGGQYRYEFPVHEFLTTEGQTRTECNEVRWSEIATVAVLPNVSIVQDRVLTGRSSPERWLRDAEVLQGVLDSDPTHPRALFYLGRTFSALGDCDAAIGVLKRRYELTERGWWEEREVAALDIFDCLFELYRFDEALEWAMRLVYKHSRIEGVVAMARRAMHEDDAAFCYALMTLACRPRLPARSLFFQPRVYTFERWQLRQACFDRLELRADELDNQEVRP